MDTAPNTIECWNLRDETPMNVLVGKDGLPDRADTGLWKEMYISFFTYTRSSQSPERSTAPNKFVAAGQRRKIGRRVKLATVAAGTRRDGCTGWQWNTVQTENVTFRLSGHFPEPDIATTRDTQELKEHRSVDHGGVPYIQRVCCSISKSEASRATLLRTLSLVLNRTNFR